MFHHFVLLLSTGFHVPLTKLRQYHILLKFVSKKLTFQRESSMQRYRSWLRIAIIKKKNTLR
jgi:hypothetical protein